MVRSLPSLVKTALKNLAVKNPTHLLPTRADHIHINNVSYTPPLFHSFFYSFIDPSFVLQKKNRVSFVSADLATVHTYPSESAAIAMYEESHNEGSCVGGDNEKNIDDVIADKSSSGDFHSYMPTSFADLTGTLERERNIIAKQNNKMGTEEETKTASEQSDKSPGFGSSGSLFTESSTGELNAILF